MPPNRPRILLTILALAAFAGPVYAIGFGPGPGSAVLGQTLDQRVGIRLDPGEQLAPECVSAEVKVGDVQLPASVVQARLVGTGERPAVRVLTLTVIDEPIVTLSVSLGCPARLSRRFTVFADPAPVSAPSEPVVAVAERISTAASEPRTGGAAVDATASAASAAAPAPTATARPGGAPAARAAAPARRPRATVRRTPRPAAAAARAQAPRPRLKLDAAEPALPPQPSTAELIQAAASAAAAEAAAQATAAASARVAAMEKAIEKLRADSAADREALRLLRQRAAEDGQAATWLPVLAALVLLLAALAAWLGLKLRRLQLERQQSWWNAAAAAPADRPSSPGAVPTEVRTDAAPLQGLVSSKGPASTSDGLSSRAGVLGPVFTPEALDEPATEPPLTAVERTEALPVGWRDDSEPQRDVSIEELIDLEQQAEFFIVLGQEEAAIDLLVDHLRSTGGGSPLPYLKLLEIYRRRGDREAYDRTRARFNHRFNAYAPDWDADTQGGRLLEDYPSIVARLQMAWPSPIDAMAELESLLFRKSRGELFDMPAYRDVLFLYSLARDLLDREPQGADNVDVLLPINDGGTDYTQPMSLDSLSGSGDSGMVPLDNPPTVPVDLDVTQPVMPDSLFGENATDPGIGTGRRRR